MNNKLLLAVVASFVLLVVILQSVFTVHQTQQAIVLQLGRPVGEVRKPGLHFKLPFVQNVLAFDARILEYDAQPSDILTQDKKALVLDNYARWRITDPLQFYRTLRTVSSAQQKLDDIVYSQLRVFLGRYSLTEIVSVKRPQIMEEVTKRSSELMAQYGVEIVDVRIKRTDLPAENQRAIFGRMRAERERQARQYRSEGQQESTKIKSQADKERAVIIAEARKNADAIRGEGEARSTAIYAEALGQSPEFFEFKRSLDAYRKSFNSDTRIILSPKDPFLKHMQ